MTDAQHPPGIETYEAPPGAAGALLRAAREGAGLSIDAVSQQLKLAPRQVKALEDGDYAQLPGRTFVRGFTRNYARLLQLDVEAVIAMLPAAESSPALDTPPIGSSAGPMGELPAASATRGGSRSRWIIPIALIAVIALGAIYEFGRPFAPRLAETRTSPMRTPDPIAPSTGIALPNPLAGGESAPPVDAPKSDAAGAASETPSTALAPQSPSPPTGDATTPGGPAGAEATLTITYRASAWTEVRDRSGQVLYTGTAPAGTTQTLSGAPPFDVVLGNADKTSVTWRGSPFDLNPHIQKNVARVRLQ